jgi:hypothetical protein
LREDEVTTKLPPLHSLLIDPRAFVVHVVEAFILNYVNKGTTGIEPGQLESLLDGAFSIQRAVPPSPWRPIETAPKSATHKIDIWAKRWIARDDKFIYNRFTDCYWYVPARESNREPHWERVPEDWCATHWTPLPLDGPRS